MTNNAINDEIKYVEIGTAIDWLEFGNPSFFPNYCTVNLNEIYNSDETPWTGPAKVLPRDVGAFSEFKVLSNDVPEIIEFKIRSTFEGGLTAFS